LQGATTSTRNRIDGARAASGATAPSGGWVTERELSSGDLATLAPRANGEPAADDYRLLEAFAAPALLAEGKVSLISLAAIARRLGPRWEIRREAIYDHAERTLAKHIGEAGGLQRISDTDYLVAQPDLGRFAAQARCLRGLREVLTYFLGQAQPLDLDVREVSAIQDGVVCAAPIDATAVLAASEREAADIAHADSAKSGDQWSPFVASNGRAVRVSCVLEPVFELKGYSRIGNRLARRVLELATDEPLSAAERARLTRADTERIDFATIARGLDRLRAEASGALQPSLIIPVSYISLSTLRSRAVLIGLFQKAQQQVQRGLICEVCDIDGVPQAALLAAISFMKPYCLFVIGRTADVLDPAARNLRGAGLQGISFEAREGPGGDAEFFGWARNAVPAAKGVAKSVMVYGLANPRRAAMAASLGATHASIRAEVRAG
jgi:hypothetical protein